MQTRKIHLSLLMFFQLSVVGSFLPIISIYLKEYLNFTGIQVGVILSISAIPSIAAPFISAWIVDRIITSRRLLILCHASAAVALIFISFQQSFSSVLITYLLYMMVLVPTFALVNALVFQNSESGSSFGSIRVWGTVGWIVAGWLVSFIWKITEGPDNMPYALWMSALFSIVMVFLTIKLPKILLKKNKKVSLIPKEALAVVIKPEVILLLFIVFLSACADKFYLYGSPLFLSDIGIGKDNILLVLSLGQFPEIIMLFALAAIIKKLDFKNIFTIAFVMQIIRFLIFWLNGPVVLTYFGVSLNGFIYSLFYTGALIYLDKFTDEKSRSGVHQIFSLVFVGLSGLLGNLMAGWVADNYLVGNSLDFKVFWIVPTVFSVLTLLIVNLFMKRKGTGKNN